MLPWLRAVRGERYEYELNLLLEARQAGYAIESVDIATVYLDHNSGSHFRPLADSARIYAPLLKFLASSLTAFLVDTVMFLILNAATDSLVLAVVGARAVSSGSQLRGQPQAGVPARPGEACGANGRPATSAWYWCCLPPTSGSSRPSKRFRCPPLAAKILAEIALLAVSYVVQQRFLFAQRALARPPGPNSG